MNSVLANPVADPLVPPSPPIQGITLTVCPEPLLVGKPEMVIWTVVPAWDGPAIGPPAYSVEKLSVRVSVPTANVPVPPPPGYWVPHNDPNPRTVKLPTVSVVAPPTPEKKLSSPPLRVIGAVSLTRLPSETMPF